MNCRSVLRLLALYLGKDSCDKEVMDEIRKHLASCPTCRSRYRQLKEAMTVLQDGNSGATFESSESMWSEVQSRLNQRRSVSSLPKSGRRWAPVVMAVAACSLIVVTLNYTLPKPQHPAGVPAYVPRDASSFSILPVAGPRLDDEAARHRALREKNEKTIPVQPNDAAAK